MTWTRLDDHWTDMPVMGDLSHAVRWHYLAMIQFCSRTGTYDGILRVTDARRCSDVPHPTDAIRALTDVGLIQQTTDDKVKVLRIEDHIPPPHVRNTTEQSKLRKRRERAHKNGDHSLCSPERCDRAERVDPVTGEVTSSVTRDTGTGQDGTGKAITRDQTDEHIEKFRNPWHQEAS